MTIRRCVNTIILCSLGLLTGTGHGQIVFVDVDAVSGNNDGSSWADAYVSLQDALAGGQGTEVWVAAGTYAPAPPNGSQALAFALRDNLGIYGGFSGTENAREQRDPVMHETVLSGDLNGDDQPGWFNMQDNSDQVITANGVSETAILDGFTITSARVTSASGAAVIVIDASPIIRNCSIENSISDFASGAGFLINGGSPLIDSCSITGNYCWLARGAGAYIMSFSTPTFVHCSFSYNQVYGGGASVADGAAVFIEFDAPAVFDHCSFSNNTADPNYPLYSNGGAICSLADGLTILHCDFVGNTADIGGALWLGRPARIENTRFTGNSAITGGAITNFIANPTTIVGCSFVFNDGQDGGAVSNSTNGVVNFSNSVLWGNTGVGDNRFKEQVHNNSATTEFSYCCIEGVFDQIQGEDPPNPKGFPGCTDLDPLFVDADGADNRGGTADDDSRLRQCVTVRF
ncbi:MAG: right-handed parallel beta-helix repeat-containing protein [Planctomycetes bacterium]|nr:right-handed parallel beta-helix repeat-containing protein [Planctomycetota bacterium]